MRRDFNKHHEKKNSISKGFIKNVEMTLGEVDSNKRNVLEIMMFTEMNGFLK